jgi:putative chitinase
MITAQQLSSLFGIQFARAQQWVDALNKAMARYDINTPKREAAFLAQIGIESAMLGRVSENLNYSYNGLLSVFPKHFSDDDAETYARKPEAIANRVYANRFGNDNEASGDGWKYRGRGLIQITFHNNYVAAGDALGIDLVHNPDLLLTRDYAALSAAWYWDSRGCNAMADAGDIHGITHAINGGFNGLDERIALNEKASTVLA